MEINIKPKRTQIYYGGITSYLKNDAIVTTESKSAILQNDMYS